jgi:hypothetical protein
MMEENKINGKFSAKNGIGVHVSKIHDAGDDKFLSLSSTTRIGNGSDNNDVYLEKPNNNGKGAMINLNEIPSESVVARIVPEEYTVGTAVLYGEAVVLAQSCMKFPVYPNGSQQREIDFEGKLKKK